MYLKKLVIHGFKSFADRTVIELEPGVTGIVGPNGCGKSNVADAIKWVLGEQSPKSLRASSMQDVLFEGADTRPAMSFCEVSLLFTDCEKEMGTAFNEVEVGRRVERDGGSDYFINGKSCRLKDIQQLFRDTGVGRVAYSFLQQGQIDKLLSSNPLDRRAVFEEAAGISGFKAKREETLRKLTEVEGNLSRLSDILTEVSSNMASLKRQASKAVRAQRLKRQLNSLDQAIIAYDLAALSEQISSKTAAILPLEEMLSGQQAELCAHEESLKTVEGHMGELLTRQQSLSNSIFEKRSLREEALSHARFLGLRAEETLSRVAALEQTLASLNQEELQTKSEVEKIENQLSQVREVAAAAKDRALQLSSAHETAQKNYEAALAEELELRSSATAQEGQLSGLQARLSALELESHGLHAQLGPINSQKETLRSDENRLREEAQAAATHARLAQESLAGNSTEAEQLSRQQDSLRAQNISAKESFEAAQRTHAELAAERNLLTEMLRRYEGFGDSTKELLSGGEYTPLVEGLEIVPDATKALTALLSLELEAICPKSVAALPVANLKNGERIALTQRSSSAAGVEAAQDFPVPEGLEPAGVLIKTSPVLDFLKSRLEGCYLCRDASRFEAIVNGAFNFEFVAVVNLDGAMIDSRGLFTAANAADQSAGYLKNSQRLQTLQGQFASSESILQLQKSHLTQLDHALQDLSQTLSRLGTEAAALKAQLSGHRAVEARSTEAQSRVLAQLQQLDEQTSFSQSRIVALEAERKTLQESFESLFAKKSQDDERARALTENLSVLRECRDGAYAALADARLKEANSQHALEVALESQRNLLSRLQEFSVRIEHTTSEISRLRHDVSSYQLQAKEKTTLAETIGVELSSLEEELRQLKEKLDEQEASSSAFRAQVENLRAAAAVTQSSLMRARLEMGELTARQSMLTDDFRRRWGEALAIESLDWRVNLFEAEFFSKADEASLETAAVQIPASEELSARFPSLNREALYADCQTLRGKLEAIGPINESALEDYKTHEARYNALRVQVDDLQAAKTELTAALMELNEQSSTLFATTFETIRGHFSKTFEQLFGGGKADLVLSTPEDPLNSGIDIMARPPGTQLKSLNLLSGGQKTMTAVALLFAIYQVKPSPFCVLDELDAPLDDANIGRFLAMLKSFTVFSQFLIITHNKRTMAASGVLYGVTMQERGVSKIISMRLSQAENYSKPAPASKEDDVADSAPERPFTPQISADFHPQLSKVAAANTEAAQSASEARDGSLGEVAAQIKNCADVPEEASKVAEVAASYTLESLKENLLKEKVAAALAGEENPTNEKELVSDDQTK